MDKLLIMKKIIIAILFLIAFTANAQTDTTKIKALQLKANLIEYLATQIVNPGNDSLYQVYIDLRPQFRVVTPPTGQTLVTIDSIPTVELANLYNYTMANSDGMSMGNQMKTQIVSARAANSYLETLCAGYEAYWQSRLIALRIAGKKLLKGK